LSCVNLHIVYIYLFFNYTFLNFYYFLIIRICTCN